MSSIIILVFFWNVHHFQKFKQQFYRFKVSHKTTLFQKRKNCKKLYKLPFFSPITSPTTTMSTIMSFPLLQKNYSFFTCCDSTNMQYYPTLQFGFATLHLRLPTCFWRLSNFVNQEPFFVFNLQANMAPDHVHFPICPKHNFFPWRFCYPKILKNLVKFPIFSPFFFFHGVGVKHITTFCYNILYTNINFKCDAPRCATNNCNTTTFT